MHIGYATSRQQWCVCRWSHSRKEIYRACRHPIWRYGQIGLGCRGAQSERWVVPDYQELCHGADWIGLSYGREAKLLCKKIIAFFSLLTKTQETGVRKLGVTQELLSLVTGLAHYLKLFIRISLQGTLKLERECRSTEGLHRFLSDLGDLDAIKECEKSLDLTAGMSGLAADESDLCHGCNGPNEDECVKLSQRGQQRWHVRHLACHYCKRNLGEDLNEALWSEQEGQVICRNCADEQNHIHDAGGSFQNVSRLQHYVYLLRVALARLLVVLRSGGTLPHTSGRRKRYKLQAER